MTLWIFGDSFSDNYFIEHDLCWPVRWGNSRNLPVCNKSKSGASNITIFKTFLDHLPRITKGDKVLVCWSAPVRYAMISDENEATEFWMQGEVEINELMWFYDKYFSERNRDITTLSQVAAMKELSRDREFDLVMFSGHVDKTTTAIADFPIQDLSIRRTVYEDFLFRYVQENLPLGSHCLLHEWFLLQFHDLKESEIWHARKIEKENDDYDKWALALFNYFDSIGKNIFYDRWHLNARGHEKFAKHIAPYLDKLFIDNKGNQ